MLQRRRGQRSPVHVLWQVGQTVVAEVQQLQAAHPQGTDGDGHETVLRDVQMSQQLEVAQLPNTERESAP